jgi:hypothetical protein
MEADHLKSITTTKNINKQTTLHVPTGIACSQHMPMTILELIHEPFQIHDKSVRQ